VDYGVLPMTGGTEYHSLCGLPSKTRRRRGQNVSALQPREHDMHDVRDRKVGMREEKGNRHLRASAEGFSLVELCVVILIVLIIAAIAIPSAIQTWYDMQLRSTSSEVADLMQRTRMLAAKKISSLELTNLYLARLEKYGHVYGAVVTILHDRARKVPGVPPAPLDRPVVLSN